MYTNGYMMRPLGQGVKKLLLINVAVFVVLFLIAPMRPMQPWWPSELFGLSRYGLMHGMFWQPITYMFVHAGLFHILANMLGLYFLGPEIETALGTRRFVYFYLGCGLVGGLGWLIFSGSDNVLGASAAVYGIIGAFAGILPRRRLTMLLYFVIPVSMTATTLALILVGASFLMAFRSGDGVAHLAHFFGAAGGYIYGRYLYQNGRPWSPSGSIGARGYGGGWNWSDLKAWYHRRNFKIVDHVEKPQAIDWSRVDAILDKVRFQGMGSLTRAEKELLDRASKAKMNNR